MQVKKAGKGWEVWDGTHFVGHFHTNAQAWRAADKHQGEAVSRAQDMSEWISRKEQ